MVNNIPDLPKAPPSPDQFISAGSGLSSLDVAMATSPSVKPLPTRADLAWERAILRQVQYTKHSTYRILWPYNSSSSSK
ncbi:hypothetical protein HY003_03660 [Candidatus Saccharibacteria bacterium]|nr:hypothetical protein [Candidatus Saccharibacteria bacterium]MBI3338369.1 hypothetical protein [Candidatus Saccharibacteria bacterium]